MAECEMYADAAAVQASRDKRRRVREVYSKALQKCRESEKAGPADVTDSANAEMLKIDGSLLTAFGRKARLPQDVVSVRRIAGGSAQIRSETTIIQLENKETLILSLQETRKKAIRKTAYPIPADMWEYERKEESDRRWVVFFGERPRTWAVLFGAYIDVSRNTRITVTVGKDISYPDARPRYPLRLAENQGVEVDEFEKRWRAWFDEAFSLREDGAAQDDEEPEP